MIARVIVAGLLAGSLAVAACGSPKPADQAPQATGPLVPQFKYDKTFPQPLPNQWKLGQVTGVSVDSRDHVWIVHRPATLKNSEREATTDSQYGIGQDGGGPFALCCRPAPPVIEFDQKGNVVQAWGGPSPTGQFEWPTPGAKSPDSGQGGAPFGEHGIYVDAQDNVWLGSDGPDDGQLLKFSRFGKRILQFGKHGASKGSNDTANANGAVDFAVDKAANEVYVADGRRNRRVLVLDAYSGTYKRHWGAYGKTPDDTTPTPEFQPDPKSPQFGELHGLTLSTDGLLYVADRVNNRIQVFKTDGTFVKEGVVAPGTLGGSAYDIALSADAGQHYAYVVDGMNQKVWILLRDSLETIGSFGYGGHYGGAFNAAWVIATDKSGNIYVGEGWESKRVQRFLYTGMGSAPAATAAAK